MIYPISSSFSFVIRVFSVDGELAHRHPLDVGGPRTGSHPSGIQLYRCSQPPHWDQTLCVAAPLEIRRYYFLLLHEPLEFEISVVLN
jgi:hypothetical protein